MLRRVSVALCAVALLTVPTTAQGAGPSLDQARDQAVRWAMTQVGHRERGTTNRSARIDRWTRGMGLRVPPARPWCGSFVHEAYRRAGIDLSARLIDPDRSYADAVSGRRGLRAIPIGSVRRGDLLFFAFRPGLKASHFALVRDTPSGGRVRTVEGNVSHAVRARVRGLAYPVLAARVAG